MSFRVADIPFFKEYQFTDTGEMTKHFGLVLLPEGATKFQNSVLCCVITSKEPRRWGLLLSKKDYSFFTLDSFACFDRKDLVSKSGLDSGIQPKGRLNKKDFNLSFKILKKSLFVIKDIASDPFLRGAIIYEWKSVLNK